MVTFEQITLDELKGAIKIAYEYDTDLFNKYHIIKGTFQECVDSTMALIVQATEFFPMEYYRVLWNNIEIGYVCKHAAMLYSYGIGIAYRRKSILKQWWMALEKLMDGSFGTALYENNKRAMRFLERNGMQLLEKNDNILSFVKYF